MLCLYVGCNSLQNNSKTITNFDQLLKKYNEAKEIIASL